jgi:hypothetical protein
MRPLTLSHLSALDVAPGELAAPAGRAGFSAIGLRLAPAAPGLISGPLPVGSAILRETKARLADAGVGVWDVELIPLTPEIDLAGFTPMLESAAALGARRLNVTGDDPDPARLADAFARVCDMAGGFGLRADLEFMRWRAGDQGFAKRQRRPHRPDRVGGGEAESDSEQIGDADHGLNVSSGARGARLRSENR